jgi:hypothetical protein
MRSKQRCRPAVELLADRVVLSHVNPVASLVHIDTAHFHVATLTFKGTYVVGPVYGANKSIRYVSFYTLQPTYVAGLGLIRIGGYVDTHAPGLALPVHPLAGNGFTVENSNFVGGNTTNPGLFVTQFGKKVAPVTKGFTFAYTFTIVSARGEFAGASGGGKAEVKLVPKPPLSANTPPQTLYEGKCTLRLHLNPSTVLT